MPHTIVVVAKSATWLVKSDEKQFETRLFSKQRNAIDFARKQAKESRAEIIIQTQRGKLGL